jgi:hypothetical protein
MFTKDMLFDLESLKGFGSHVKRKSFAEEILLLCLRAEFGG